MLIVKNKKDESFIIYNGACELGCYTRDEAIELTRRDNQGSFHTNLWKAIKKADLHNLELLSLGFPYEVGLWAIATGNEGFFNQLQGD